MTFCEISLRNSIFFAIVLFSIQIIRSNEPSVREPVLLGPGGTGANLTFKWLTTHTENRTRLPAGPGGSGVGSGLLAGPGGSGVGSYETISQRMAVPGGRCCTLKFEWLTPEAGDSASIPFGPAATGATSAEKTAFTFAGPGGHGYNPPSTGEPKTTIRTAIVRFVKFSQNDTNLGVLIVASANVVSSLIQFFGAIIGSILTGLATAYFTFYFLHRNSQRNVAAPPFVV